MSGVRSPLVAFGLQAATCALKAKCGQLGARDREALALNALEFMRGDHAACAAVIDFLSVAQGDQRVAGKMLEASLPEWCPEVEVGRAEEVLARYEAERAAGFDWMAREGESDV